MASVERLILTPEEASLPNGLILTMKRVKKVVGDRTDELRLDLVFPESSYGTDPALLWYQSRRGVVPVRYFMQLMQSGGNFTLNANYSSKSPDIISLEVRRIK